MVAEGIVPEHWQTGGYRLQSVLELVSGNTGDLFSGHLDRLDGFEAQPATGRWQPPCTVTAQADIVDP